MNHDSERVCCSTAEHWGPGFEYCSGEDVCLVCVVKRSCKVSVHCLAGVTRCLHYGK
jgi:hypothetical protein